LLKDGKGEPMMFTNCVLLQRQDSAFAFGTTSDLDGVFSLAGIKQGEYILRITAVGHETWWQDIVIDHDTNLGVIEIADGNGSKKGQKDSAFIRDGVFAAKRIPSFILAFGLHPLDNRQTDFRLRSKSSVIGESRRYSSGKKDQCTDDKCRRKKHVENAIR
jgi:hypothetical protein